MQNWGLLDEREMAQRRRANRNRTIGLTILGTLLFCGFISVLLGTPQSYVAQALVTLPKYPGAQPADCRNGLDCPVTLDVYCYNSTYRTSDSAQQVMAYYEGLRRPGFMPSAKFVAENGRRFFGDYQNASVCAEFLGHHSCTEIAVLVKGGWTEINYLEIGQPGSSSPQDPGQ